LNQHSKCSQNKRIKRNKAATGQKTQTKNILNAQQTNTAQNEEEEKHFLGNTYEMNN
jgi:hypothetical protein